MPEFFGVPRTTPDPSLLLPTIQREARRRRRRRQAWLSATAVMVLLVGTGIAFGVSAGNTHGSRQILLTTPSPRASSSAPSPSAPPASSSPARRAPETRSARGDIAILRKVNWPGAVDPLHCGSLGVFVAQVAYTAQGSHGHAVLLLRCNSGASTWPDGLFVYALSEGHVRLEQVLLQPTNGSRGPNYIVNGSFKLTGPRLVLTGRSYSSDSVAQCCPDQTRTDTWRWTGSEFSREF